MQSEIDRILRLNQLQFGLSDSTVSTYRRHLAAFSAWLAAEERAKRWEDVRPRDVVDFLIHQSLAGSSEAKRARTLVSIKGFFKRYVRENRIEFNPAGRVPAPKARESLPVVLSETAIEQLMDWLEQQADDEYMQRDRALIEFLYMTGARIGEALALKKSAFDPELKTVKLFRPKTSNERVLPLGNPCRAALEQWLSDGRPYILSGKKDYGWLFISSSGAPLSYAQACRRIASAAVSAGLPGRVTPHVFRHSCATHMLNNGADLRSVQEILGHESILNTERYAKIAPKKAFEAYRKYFPRS